MRNFKSHTSSEHRLGRGLPGYLILFAPHAFVPQRQYKLSQLPSQLVFYGISKNSPLHATFRQPQLDSSNTVSKAILQLSCQLSLLTYAAAYAPFKPSDSG